MNARKHQWLRLGAWFCLLLMPVAIIAQTGGAASQAGGLQTPVLRHRVCVLAMPPMISSSNNPAVFIAKSEGWRTLLLPEGITITPEEWATALDLTKACVSSSDLMRVVEAPPWWMNADLTSCPSDTLPAYVLLARYGARTNGRLVYFRLLDSKSGAVLAAADATAADMSAAIEKALERIRNEIAMRAWRCHVVGVNGQQIVIDRGHLDGLRMGDQLQGYSIIPQQGKSVEGIADEQLILQYGKKTGTYRITENLQNFSKVEPTDNAPMLAVNDVLELPDIWLKDRKRETRGRRLWDKIYDDKDRK